MSWTKKELVEYIKNIENHRNKIRIIDIKLDNDELSEDEREELIHKRWELKNTLDQVEICIKKLNKEEKKILESNIKNGIPLKSLTLNYSLNYISQMRNKMLNNIVETLNL